MHETFALLGNGFLAVRAETGHPGTHGLPPIEMTVYSVSVFRESNHSWEGGGPFE